MTSPTAGYFGSANFSAYSGSSAGGWPSFGSLDNVSNDGNSLNMQLGADTLQINKDGSVNISGPGGQKITEWGDPHVGTGSNNNEETTNQVTSFNSNDGHYTVTVVPTPPNSSGVSTVGQVYVRDNYTGETKQVSGFNSNQPLTMSSAQPWQTPQASADQSFHWDPSRNDLVNAYGETPSQVQQRQNGGGSTDPFFGTPGGGNTDPFFGTPGTGGATPYGGGGGSMPHTGGNPSWTSPMGGQTWNSPMGGQTWNSPLGGSVTPWSNGNPYTLGAPNFNLPWMNNSNGSGNGNNSWTGPANYLPPTNMPGGSLDNYTDNGSTISFNLGSDKLDVNKDGSVNITGPGGQKITEWGDPHVGTGTNNNEETTNETTSFNSNDGHYTVTVVPTQANGSDVSTVNQVFVRDNFTGETKQISGFNGGSGGNSTGGLSMQNSSPYTMPQASAAQTFHWSPALNDLVNSYGQTPAQVQAGPVVTDPFFGQTPPFMSM